MQLFAYCAPLCSENVHAESISHLLKGKTFLKAAIILFLITCLQANTKLFGQAITFHAKGVSMETAVKELARQSGYRFLYSPEILQGAGDVDVDLQAVSLTKALDQCLSGKPLSYTLVGKSVVIRRKTENTTSYLRSDTTKIRGRVFDENGRPLEGVNVVNNGKGQTKVYTITKSNGEFELDGQIGDQLFFSYVGFKNEVRSIDRLDDMTVRMQLTQHELDSLTINIVNTGYQTLSKVRATGSFSKPDMKVFSNRTNSMDVISRLEGQIPGMTVTIANGDAYGNNAVTNSATGAKTQKALIRGAGSVRLSTEPLYVVNGIAVQDFSALNIDDIADITVLKDAAASAIWGSKAANGVIVVTTKSGEKNQKLQIAYNGFVSFEGKPNFGYIRKQYASSREYIDVARQLFDPQDYPYSQFNTIYNYDAIPPSQQVLYDLDRGLISADQANAALDSMASIDNTKQVEDLLFSNAFTTNHTLSLSGGTNRYSSFASLGYNDAHSYFPGQGNKAYKMNLNQTFTPNDRLSFSLNAQLAEHVSNGNSQVNVPGNILPYQLFKDANGNNINMPYLSAWTPEVIQQYSAASNIDLATYNPLNEVNYVQRKTNFYALNLVGNATVKLWKGLSYQGTYGYAVSPTTSSTVQDNQAFSYRQRLLNNTMPGDPPTYLIPEKGVLYQTGNNNQRSWTVRNQLVYHYEGRGGNDLISLQVGQEANEVKTTQNSSTIYGYDQQLQTYPLLDYYTLSQGIPGTVGGYGGNIQAPFRESITISRYSSYFALASYTFNHKYSLDGSWRVDHSNLFGSDVSSQNKPSYSLGGKWNMKGEHFLDDANWLSALAVRATYGVAGNSPYVGLATAYDVLYAEQIPNYTYPVIGGPAYQLSSPANKRLSWEATRTTNLGVDFGLFNSRFTGSLEYYHKNTTDLLGQSVVNYFTGFASSTANIGQLVNDGVNMSLNSNNIATDHFSWQTGFVLGYNQNKLVTYEAPQSYQQTASYWLYPTNPVLGYALNSMFAYQYAGLNADGDPQIRLANGEVTSTPGVATSKDLIYKGTTLPKFNGGLTNYFQYKQFGLSVNLVYSLGGVMRTISDYQTQIFSGALKSSSNIDGNVTTDFLHRWQKPGDEKVTNIPRYLAVADYNLRDIGYYLYSDVNVASASFVKLSEMALSYTLNADALRWLKISSAVLRLQVNNILLWKANKLGINPEYQNAMNGGRVMPLGQHSVTIGANINF